MQTFRTFRGIEINTYEAYTVYEWRLNFDKKKTLEGNIDNFDEKEEQDNDDESDDVNDEDEDEDDNDHGNEEKLNFCLHEVRRVSACLLLSRATMIRRKIRSLFKFISSTSRAKRSIYLRQPGKFP